MNSTQNKLIEISGEGSVILRAICDFTIDDVEYKTGDIVYFIPSCNINCQYNSRTRAARQGLEVLMAESNRYLSTIRLNYIPLTERLLQLFGKTSGDKVLVPTIEKQVAFDGTIYLVDLPKDKIRVYDSLGNYFGEYEALPNNSIEDPNFEEEVVYTLLYDVEKITKAYDINTLVPDLPYLSTDIVIEGNVDKQRSSTLIHVDRVGINSIPVIDMFGNKLTMIDLQLNVIDSPVLLSVI